MKAGAHVDFPYDYILYRYGPFSFELRDYLQELCADGLLTLEAQPYPYGPRLATTPQAAELQDRYPKTLAAVEPAMDWTLEVVGAKGVSALERLATALYIDAHDGIADPNAIADRLVGLKPHVSLDQALGAAKEMLAALNNVPA
jgi:uncharacterized protein YwgA